MLRPALRPIRLSIARSGRRIPVQQARPPSRTSTTTTSSSVYIFQRAKFSTTILRPSSNTPPQPPSATPAAPAEEPSTAAAPPPPPPPPQQEAALPKPPDLDPQESHIWDLLTAEFAPSALHVRDVSGGCGSMYSIDLTSAKFRGVSVLKQQRMVNAALGDMIKGWHGIQLRTTAE